VLGYPGEVSKSLDADHHGVCKYESRKDPNYIHVRNWLATMVKRIRKGGMYLQSHTMILIYVNA
jgi:hypothetical protein